MAAVPPVFTTIAVLGALTGVLASLLALANRKLQVDEDPRLDAVETMLPGTNCGACGQPGCRAFAEALLAGDALPAACTVSTDEGRSAIAAFLGVGVGVVQRRVARLACAGGSNVAPDRARYVGVSTCAMAARVDGGPKGCAWGCIGLGDCQVACDFDAIVMNAHDLPVVDADRCTACGDCVDACPKDLFTIEPLERRLWVACRSRLAGDEALAECAVACDACGRCAADSGGAIEMIDNLPRIRPTGPQPREAIERCPTGAIVWLDEVPVRGRAARRIVRAGRLPIAPT